MKHREDETSLSLNSFLDIMTNVVGVMVLVAVLAVVSSQHIALSLGTPILRDAPEDAERMLFECRRNRVVFLDENKIDEAILAYVEDYAEQYGEKPDVEELPEMFEAKDVGDEFYRVKVELSEGIRIEDGNVYIGSFPDWIYEPRKEKQGERMMELRRDDSNFAKVVRELNSEDHWVFFIVYQDSFEVFRMAREIARRQGLAIGWHPMKNGKEIRFSGSGGIGGETMD